MAIKVLTRNLNSENKVYQFFFQKKMSINSQYLQWFVWYFFFKTSIPKVEQDGVSTKLHIVLQRWIFQIIPLFRLFWSSYCIYKFQWEILLRNLNSKTKSINAKSLQWFVWYFFKKTSILQVEQNGVSTKSHIVL